MPIDVETPGSDGWWLRRLAKQMHERPSRVSPRLCDDRRWDFTRNEWLDMLWARFCGNTPLLHVSDRYAEATREFMRLSRTNFAGLIVRALQDRTQFVGATAGAAEDADGDDTIRDFLAVNGAFMGDALTFTYALGRGFVMVSPPQPGEVVATATAEDPRLVAVATDPVRANLIRAALKLYRDDDADEDVAHLFLPADGSSGDRVRVAFRPGPSSWTGIRFSPREWSWDETRSGDLEVQGLGVPIVPIVNYLGMGEFEPCVDLLDRITNGIADRLWSAKFQTFMQRAVKGDLPQVDADGNPIDYNSIFTADPGALWMLPPESDIWESRQLDINGLLAPVRDDLKELASVTQTPLHMFTPDAMTGSAEGASTMRETLTFKADDRIRRFRAASVRIARLGLAYSGRPADVELVPMWAPTERYSLQQRGAAAVQAKTSGVPQRSILSDVWQFAPATVARMERERRQDLLFAPAVPAPTVTGQQPPTPGNG